MPAAVAEKRAAAGESAGLKRHSFKTTALRLMCDRHAVDSESAATVKVAGIDASVARDVREDERRGLRARRRIGIGVAASWSPLTKSP